MKMKNTQKMNGNYILSRWNSWSYDIAIIPEDSEKLFYSNGGTNVLFYLDRDNLDESESLGMFLAINLAKDPYFNIAISTNYDSEVINDADIVINLFGSENEKFDRDLNEYNGKLFVKEDLDGIRSLKDFIDKIKLGIVKGNLNVEVKLEVKG